MESDRSSGVLGLQTGAEGNGGKTIETLLTATLGIRNSTPHRERNSLLQTSETFAISCCTSEREETVLFL